MRFNKTPVSDLWLIELEPFEDDRGQFARAYCEQEFSRHGLPDQWAQMNLSRNPARGTLRGFHYQLPPHGEGKLIRSVNGSIFDMAIDMRPHSPSYGQFFGCELSSDMGNALFIPAGCAHAFVTLEDNVQVFYMATQPYVPNSEHGIRFNDPSFDIKLPIEVVKISDKDASWPLFEQEAHEQAWRQPR